MSPKFIFEKTELLTSFKYNIHIEKCTDKSDVCAWALRSGPLRSDGPLRSAVYASALSHTISNTVSLNFLISTDLKGDSSNSMQFNFHFCECAFATCLKDIFCFLCIALRWLLKFSTACVFLSTSLALFFSGSPVHSSLPDCSHQVFLAASFGPLPRSHCFFWNALSFCSPLLWDFSVRPLVHTAHLSELP